MPQYIDFKITTTKIINRIIVYIPDIIIKFTPQKIQLELLKFQPKFNRVIYVNADQISNLCYPELIGEKNKVSSHSFLFSADLKKYKCKGGSHLTIKQLMSGIKYEETSDYKRLKNKLEKFGKTTKGVKKEADIIAYLKKVELLIQNIQKNGINVPKFESDQGIQVCIDENGRICKVWKGGTHRYGIVRELEMNNFPVFVSHMHEQFLMKIMSEFNESPIKAIEKYFRNISESKDH